MSETDKGTAGAPRAAAGGGEKRPRKGRWLRGLAAALLAAVAALVLAEVGLRVAGKGFSPRYLVPGKDADGTPVWMDNAFFSYRFFPRRTAPLPLPVRVSKEKPAEVLRVVLLGDSALTGEPDPAFGVGRILEPMLQAKFPGRRVETLSLGLSGGNSHVLREIARDLDRLAPDAVVLMTGNNEISGPYGPASPTGRLHTSSRIARLLILANRTRLRQVIAAALVERSPEREDARAWRDAEPLTLRDRLERGDPRLGTAERSFRKNYRALIAAARDAAPVVLACTVPVNLRDCAPFATAYLPDETDAQRVRELVRSALGAEKAGEAERARRAYSEALELDPGHAEALFRSARLAERLGDGAAADPLYRAARDADALPLRATSALNEIIRDEARRGRLEPLDAEALFAEWSETGVPGNDLFLDHVHFTFEARCKLAAAMTDRIAAELGGGAAGAAAPTPKEVSGLLLFSPWGKRYELDALIHGHLVQPFLRQSTHAESLSRLRAELKECDERLSKLPPRVSHEIFSRRQLHRTGDAWLSARAAYYLLQAGDLERAHRAAEAVLSQWPHRYDARALLAFVEAMDGGTLENGLSLLCPEGERCGYYDVQFAISVGKNLNGADRPESAEAWLRHALGRDPWNSGASIALSDSLYRQQRYDESVDILKAALERTPKNPLLWDELSGLYCLIDRWELSDEAMKESGRVAPYRFQRFHRRAEVLSRLHQYGRAIHAIEQYLEAVPEDPDAIALRDLILSNLPPPEPAGPPPAVRKRMPWE